MNLKRFFIGAIVLIICGGTYLFANQLLAVDLNNALDKSHGASNSFFDIFKSKKTKFILHGGFANGQIDDSADSFFSEILKDAPDVSKVLLVCFARDTEEIPNNSEMIIGEFNKNNLGKELHFEIANEESFLEQVAAADIVYLQGGKTFQLLEILKKYPEFKNVLRGKIIAGESAGANVLGSYFYSKSNGKAGIGLDLVHVKIIPHYSGQYKNELDDVGIGLELLLLSEGQFKVFII